MDNIKDNHNILNNFRIKAILDDEYYKVEL